MESMFQDCGIEYVFIVKDPGGIVIGVQKVHVRVRFIRPSAISRNHGKTSTGINFRYCRNRFMSHMSGAERR